MFTLGNILTTCHAQCKHIKIKFRSGVQLGLQVYHACEPEIKKEFELNVYDDQIGMMEMVLDVDDIVNEMTTIREQFCKY
ncbi:hypothetical protein K0040_05130 [Terrisporobacter petrolearius]|nr:hypothetical protein [Terrisporobacter petrolearius]